MMWDHNFWLFCDNKDRLVCLVNDIIEELPDLDMEPKPESLWWTCNYKDDDVRTLKIRSRGNSWDLFFFLESFEVLG